MHLSEPSTFWISSSICSISEVLVKFGVIFADMISPGQGIFQHNFTVQELTKLLRITEYKFTSWVVDNQNNLFIFP